MRAIRWRLFVTCWMVMSLHFATNIVREHYPAFTLIDQGNFFLDEYAGFHPDIFEHTNGHHVIGNQVTGSMPAVVPLLMFKPVLDWLGDRGAQQVAAAPPKAETDDFAYKTEHRNRRAFFEKVNARGLAVKFGAAAAITTVFCMAPLSALLAVVFFELLRRFGLSLRLSLWLAFLSVLGTPVFYRTGYLNHNLFFALATFASFLCLWRRAGIWQQGEAPPLSGTRRFWGGVFAGLTLALDYAGVVTLGMLALYHLYTEWHFHSEQHLLTRWSKNLGNTVRGVLPFVGGTFPPVLFLWATQWWTYGHPFLPGQFWMPDQNVYVGEGVRGMTPPDVQLFLLNLFDLDWGLFSFGPMLLLAVVPLLLWKRRGDGPAEGLVEPREKVFIAALCLSFMLFCSINQYSRLQWNTGFRYLLPLVPFLFLVAVEPLARMKRSTLAVVSALAFAHTWVLSMVRHTPPSRGDAQAVPESWRVVLTEGLQLPWLSVIRTTPTIDHPLVNAVWLPYAFFALLALAIGALWWGPLRPAALGVEASADRRHRF